MSQNMQITLNQFLMLLGSFLLAIDQKMSEIVKHVQI